MTRATTDWVEIEKLWKRGLSNPKIAEAVGGISSEGIRKRAKKYGWRRDGDNPEPEPERRDWLAEIPEYKPLDEFDRPEARATVLSFLDVGSPLELAADYAGVDLDRLEAWVKSDKDFAEQVRAARADALLHQLNKLKDCKDPRLQLDILSRLPDTKRYYAPPQQGSKTAIQVNVGNMPTPGDDGITISD